MDFCIISLVSLMHPMLIKVVGGVTDVIDLLCRKTSAAFIDVKA